MEVGWRAALLVWCHHYDVVFLPSRKRVRSIVHIFFRGQVTVVLSWLICLRRRYTFWGLKDLHTQKKGGGGTHIRIRLKQSDGCLLFGEVPF